MKTLIIYTVLIVAGIEYGGQAVDRFFDQVNAEVAEFQAAVDAQREH